MPSVYAGSDELQKKLSDAQAAIDSPLRNAIGRLTPPLQAIAEYHFGWRNEHGRPGGAPLGRRRLGMLALLCASVNRGPWRRALPAAIACELAFNAAMIRDDVIDHDATRRGRAAVWSAFGAPAAILLSDALTALAFEILVEGHPEFALEATRRLNRAIDATNAGQLLDIAFEERTDVDLDECLDMFTKKAGAFVECACALGALFAGGGDVLKALAEFGNRLGVIWQLHNDLLGIWGDPERTGKPALSDLKARKKTFPVLSALASVGEDSQRLADLYLVPGRHVLSDEDAIRAATLVERCGGRRRTRQETQHRLELALDALAGAMTDTQAHAALSTLARYYTASDH